MRQFIGIAAMSAIGDRLWPLVGVPARACGLFQGPVGLSKIGLLSSCAGNQVFPCTRVGGEQVSGEVVQ